jgi:hypothetical protein
MLEFGAVQSFDARRILGVRRKTSAPCLFGWGGAVSHPFHHDSLNGLETLGSRRRQRQPISRAKAPPFGSKGFAFFATRQGGWVSQTEYVLLVYLVRRVASEQVSDVIEVPFRA